MILLPDLPGYVTGIKRWNPLVIQCPTCGHCFTSPVWTITAGLVPFWDRKNRPKLRQCRDCWAGEGWYISNYYRIRDGDPEEARKALEREDPTRNKYRMTPEAVRELFPQQEVPSCGS